MTQDSGHVDEDQAGQEAQLYGFLDTPLTKLLSDKWPEACLLSVDLVVALELHGNASIGDLFWHGKRWFKSSSRRRWLNRSEANKIATTLGMLRRKFRSQFNTSLDPVALLSKRSAAYTYKPMERSLDSTTPNMVMMHRIY